MLNPPSIAAIRWSQLVVLLLCVGVSDWRTAYAQVSGDVGIHDPSSVITDGSNYYLYGTGEGILNKRSTDGVTWIDEPTGVYTSLPAWTTAAVPSFTGTFWAPDIEFFNGQYHLYYSVSEFGTIDSAIGLATTPTLDRSSPSYEWTDQGKVVQSDALGFESPNTDTTFINAIDPSILAASDGRLWMTWGSYSSGIYITELDPSTGNRLNTSSLDATLVANNAPGGGWGSTLEGASLLQDNDYYYLFFNDGGCCSGTDSTYEIRVGRSTSPTGPFLDKDGVDLRNGGGSIFLDDNGRYIGPGHFERFVDFDSTEYYGFHYYDGDQVGAPKYDRRPFYWTSDNWPSAAAVNLSWDGTVNNNWSSAGNWYEGVPNGVGHVANFDAISSGQYAVSLGGAGRTIGTANFRGNSTYTIGTNGGPTLTLNAISGESATLNVAEGSHTIAAPLSAADHLGVNVSQLGSNLTLSGGVAGSGLSKYGPGKLTLAGSTNTFTSNIFVKKGTLEVTGTVSAGAFSSVGQIVGDTGTLNISGTGQFTANADLNIGDTGTSNTPANGVLNLSDSGSVIVGAGGGFFVGSGFFSNSRAEGTVNQSGGTLTVNNPAGGSFVVGGRNSDNANGTYNLSGGTVNANTSVRIGGVGTGTLNISNTGQFTTNSSFFLGFNSSGVGTLNLDGGTLSAPRVQRGSGTGTLNFDGGTLRATASHSSFLAGLTSAQVQTGGAVFDTQSHVVTVAQQLLHDSALGANPDGGLTKRGTGTLTLAGVNTYTGDTDIETGTLRLTGSASIASSQTIKVHPGATLDVSGLSGTFAVANGQTLTNRSNTTVVGPVLASSGSKVQGNGTFEGNLTALAGSTLKIGASTTVPTSSLAVTNGNFESGIFPPGDADVDFWFDVDTFAGASDFWNTAQHEQGLSPTPDAGVLLGDGNGAIGGPNGAGGRWMYQQIGTKDANGSYTLSFDYGGDLNANTSDRAVAIRVEIYQGAFAGAADDNDIADEGLTLITTLDSPTTSLWGEGNFASFNSTLDLSSANSVDPLWLRVSNLPGAGTDPGSWVVIDNVDIQGTLTTTATLETMTVSGDVSLDAGSIVSFDIGTSGNNDLLDISGNLGVADGTILEILLADGVSASSFIAGNSWELFNFSSTTGTLNPNDIVLPAGLDSGLEWNTANLLTTGVLSITLAGDFNLDGTVDGLDFLAWQRDPAIGDLADWQSNYGSSALSLTASSVPEPNTAVIVTLAVITTLITRGAQGSTGRDPRHAAAALG